MNWPKVSLKYQRNESFHNCYEARKIIVGPNSSIFPTNWWSERKNKGKEETSKKKKSFEFYNVSRVSGVNNKNA